jgi:prophage tail gpP-like protein
MSDQAVTLQIGANIHHGWTGVQVRMSLQRLSGSFEVQATDTWTEDGRTVSWPIRALDPVTLAIGGVTAITGRVDEVAPTYRAGEVGLRISGRDATARLLDCSTLKREFKGAALAQIAAALCQPYGIPVKLVGWDGGKAYTKYTVDAGQTVARAIEDGCRQLGVLMWTDGLGTLLLGRPAAGEHVGRLKLGVHILEGEASDGVAERYSEVRVLSNKTGEESWESAGDTPQGLARDPDIALYRPLVLTAEAQGEGAATPQQRAEWEVTVRRARARTTSLTVSGWAAPSGALWRPGQRVEIEDRRLGRNETLMVAEVALSKSRDGTKAQLQLLPEAAFTILAEGQGKQGEDDE